MSYNAIQVRLDTSTTQNPSPGFITSESVVNFKNFQGNNSIESQKITVPEIHATWWLEICPVRDEDHAEYDSDGERQIPTFHVADDSNNHDNHDNKPIIRHAPEVKVHVQFHDEIIYASNLFTVTINVDEFRPGSHQAHLNFHNNHVININEFSNTASSKASNSAASKQSYEYSYQETQNRRGSKENMMQLDVRSRLEFKFVGKFAQNFHGAVAGLKSLSSKSFGILLKAELFSDLTLISGGKMFKVHKCVLANASKVFNLMLRKNETKIKPTIINSSPDIFESFLKFIYEGHIPFRQMKNTLICCDLFEMAHRYKVKTLEEISRRYVTQMKYCNQIDSKNALKVFEFAETYKFKQMMDSAWPIIKTELLNITVRCPLPNLKEITNLLEKKTEIQGMYEQVKNRFIDEKTEGVIMIDSDHSDHSD